MHRAKGGVKIERIWHNHNKWEDYKAGMYNKRTDKAMIRKSHGLLSSPYNLFVEMANVSKEWKMCSEFSLSNLSSNRKAWLGWASCCYRHGATDEETRAAWNKLSCEQKAKANGVADIVIKAWEQNYYGCKYA